MTTRMPTFYISHGGGPWPWMTEYNGNAYDALARSLARMPQDTGARPRAILMVSAHWEEPAFTAMGHPSPPMLYDYYNFPDYTYSVRYPAPGDPALAEQARGLVAAAGLPAAIDAERGFDHGMFAPMAVAWPQADVPVVQLSINALKPMDYHLELAGRLNQLRQRGVMIVSSGNVVHNLRRIEWNKPDAGAAWAQRFDDTIARQMTEAPADILTSLEHPDFAMAVPTPDHFIPLLYTAGLAAEKTDAKALLRGYALGSLSMTCYGVGMDGVNCEEAEGAAALPKGVPPDQTNI